MRKRKWLVLLAVLAMTVAACGDGDDVAEPDAGDTDTTEAPAELTPVKVQLQWFAQAQFAGYYAAVAEGFYEEEGLDVTILEGAVDIVPQQVVATGGAEFGLA
ncbi:MAG: ABC transporter substrate-binding protein, partial [Acidimicrobiia bacterium]